jgi:hypothetical protein
MPFKKQNKFILIFKKIPVNQNTKQRSSRPHPSRNCCKTTPNTTDPLESNVDDDQDDVPLRDRLGAAEPALSPNSGSNAANPRERSRKRKAPQPRWSREQSTSEVDDSSMHTTSDSQATETIITNTRGPRGRTTKRKIEKTATVNSLDSSIETGV